jgi:hypothetical protein
MAFLNMIMKGISGHQTDEAVGKQKQLHKEEIHNLHTQICV